MARAKVPDMPMQAEDILLVPSGAGKVALCLGSEAIVQAAVGLSIVAAAPAIACKDQAAVLSCSLSRIPSNTAM